jgi:hypothetical protein
VALIVGIGVHTGLGVGSQVGPGVGVTLFNSGGSTRGTASLSTTQKYTAVSAERLVAVYDRAHPRARGSEGSARAKKEASRGGQKRRGD